MQWHLAYHVEAPVVVQAVDWFHKKRVEGDMLDLLSGDFLIISKENKTSSNPLGSVVFTPFFSACAKGLKDET